MTSMADVVSKAESERAQAEHDARRQKDEALKAELNERNRRNQVLQLAALIPQQGGGFWKLVEQIENYLTHGDPTGKF